MKPRQREPNQINKDYQGQSGSSRGLLGTIGACLAVWGAEAPLERLFLNDGLTGRLEVDATASRNWGAF